MSVSISSEGFWSSCAIICRETVRTQVKSHPKPTALQKADLHDSRWALATKIRHFCEAQAFHMPGLHSLFRLQVNQDCVPSENVILHLPSEITDSTVCSHICSAELVAAEDRLREAEANDALEELRRLLRTRTALNQAKVKHVTGQRPNTRAREVQRRMDARVTECKLRYRHSHEQILALPGKGTWEAVLQELRDEDVRALNKRERNREERAEQERLQEMAKLGLLGAALRKKVRAMG